MLLLRMRFEVERIAMDRKFERTFFLPKAPARLLNSH